VAQVLEPLQDVPALGPEVTVLPDHVQQPAIAVVLGFKEPGGVIEGIAPRSEEDRLDYREGARNAGAPAGHHELTLSRPERFRHETLVRRQLANARTTLRNSAFCRSLALLKTY
jgi:hypothetical protein